MKSTLLAFFVSLAATTAANAQAAGPLAPNATAAAICGDHYTVMQHSCDDPENKACQHSRTDYDNCLSGYATGVPNKEIIPPPAPASTGKVTYEK